MQVKLQAVLLIILAAILLSACEAAAEAPAASPAPAASATPARTPTPWPTVTPVVTPTVIPTATGTPQIIPSPLPADARDYELCVGIASDSNGYGHVTFQIPDPSIDNQVVILYVQPLAVPLRAHLDARGLDYLEVRDRSLSAAGLTTETSNYLESGQYAELREARCKFVVITPFIPDVAVNLVKPDVYVQNLGQLINGFVRSTPDSRLLVLNFYPTRRADFTANNSGLGVVPERLAQFNTALAEACKPDGVLGQLSQVVCVDISDLGDDVVVESLREPEYRAVLYRTNVFNVVVDDYFERNPDGVLIGDGVHLNPAGRDRLAQRLADIIFELADEF